MQFISSAEKTFRGCRLVKLQIRELTPSTGLLDRYLNCMCARSSINTFTWTVKQKSPPKLFRIQAFLLFFQPNFADPRLVFCVNVSLVICKIWVNFRGKTVGEFSRPLPLILLLETLHCVTLETGRSTCRLHFAVDLLATGY